MELAEATLPYGVAEVHMAFGVDKIVSGHRDLTAFIGRRRLRHFLFSSGCVHRITIRR
jgi:hypothetical protein